MQVDGRCATDGNQDVILPCHKSRRQKHPVNDVRLQHGKSKFKVVKLFLLPGLVPCRTARAFVWSAHP